MPDLKVINIVPSKLVRVVGTQHEGWLPAASIPPPTAPTRDAELMLELQDDGSGFLLCVSSLDGSIHGDTWHTTEAEAKAVALEEFGVHDKEWQPYSEAVLGAEYDESAFSALKVVVASLGGTLRQLAYRVGGSQEIEMFLVCLPHGNLKATRETYVGLVLQGSRALVEQVSRAISEA